MKQISQPIKWLNYLPILNRRPDVNVSLKEQDFVSDECVTIGTAEFNKNTWFERNRFDKICFNGMQKVANFAWTCHATRFPYLAQLGHIYAVFNL